MEKLTNEPKIKRISKISFDIIIESFNRFNKNRAIDGAAAISYYVVFSIFPLVSLLVVLAASFLEPEAAKEFVFNTIQQLIPGAQDGILNYIEQVLMNPRTLSIPAGIGLVWSASGMFTTLGMQLNRAWPNGQSRGFIKQKIIGIAMIGVLFMIMILSLFSTTLLKFVPWDRLVFLEIINFDQAELIQSFSFIIPFILRTVLLWALYYFVPNQNDVNPGAALIGATFSSTLWEISIKFFTWYLSSSFARYEIIYGSLGSIIAFMFWVFIISYILIIGGYFVATIDLYIKRNRFPSQTVKKEVFPA